MSPVLPREASQAQVLPPPSPPPPEPARPVKSGVDLGHPQQPLSLVAKKEVEKYQRYWQWLDHELARLPPYKADAVRKALAEIFNAQSCTATDAAFDEWLEQPGHEKLKAVYNDYLNPVTIAIKLGPAPLDPVEAWLFDGHLNAKSIVAALQGQSTLGKLQDDDKRHLLDRALTNFSHLAFDKIEELAVLVRDDPKIDPETRRLVAERLLQRAVHPGDDADNPRAQARAYALDFLRAMRNDPRGMAELVAQLSPQDGFRLARALGQEELPDPRLTTSRTAGWQDDHRLGAGPEADPRLNNPNLLAGARDQMLAGLQKLAGTPAARSPAVTAVVYGLADEISGADLERTPGLAHSLAVALADQWDPNNPPAERLEALLTSRSGTSLMCTGSPDWKAAARETVRTHPDLTAAMLEREGGDPGRNPKVAAAVASLLVAVLHGRQASAATAEENAGIELVASALQTKSGQKLLFDEKVSPEARREVLQVMLADHGQKLTRAAFEHASDAWQIPGIAGPLAAQKLAALKPRDLSSLSAIGKTNLIGLWLGKDPAADVGLTGQDIAAAQQALAGGEIPPFLNEKDFYPDNKELKKFAGTVRLGLEHAVLFSEGIVPVPLLHGRELDGTEFYLDQDGNVFRDSFPQDKNDRVSFRSAFQDFLDTNPLAAGTLYFQGQGFQGEGFQGGGFQGGGFQGGGFQGEGVATSPLGPRETPAARDTSKKVAHGIARGLTGAAIIAAIVGTDGLAGAAFAYAGLLGMGYLAYEDYGHVTWLAEHGHSFTNPDQAMLAASLDLVADAAGPLEAAGGTAARGLTALRMLSPEKAKLFTVALGLFGKGANRLALARTFGEMLRNPGSVTPEQALQAAVFAWMSLRQGPPRPAIEHVPAPAPPGDPIPIGTAPRVTKNPTIGKLEPGKAPVTPIRTAAPSSPGKGYDPAASSKPPANSNVSPDAVQPAIKITADGSRPRDGRAAAMASDHGGKPPGESPKPQPSSGTPKAGQGAPPLPAAEGGTPGAGKPTEVEKAGKRVSDLQQALFEHPEKFEELTKKLEQAEKQHRIAVARQDLANRIAARERAAQASKNPLPNQDPAILRLALQRAEVAVADVRHRLQALEKQPAGPTSESGVPAAVSPAPKSGPTVSPTAPTTLRDLWADFPNLTRKLQDWAGRRSAASPAAGAPVTTDRSHRPTVPLDPNTRRTAGKDGKSDGPKQGAAPKPAGVSPPAPAGAAPKKPASSPLPGIPDTGEPAPPRAPGEGGASGAGRPTDVPSARERVLGAKKALVAKREEEIAGLKAKISGLQKNLDESTDQSIDRKRTIHELAVAEQALGAAERALDVAKTQLKSLETAPRPAAEKTEQPPPASAPSATPAVPEPPAITRLRDTAIDLANKNPRRTIEVLSSPKVYRHTLTGDLPFMDYARIEKEGSLWLAADAKAQYGDGVYAWLPGKQGSAAYIDIEVPAGTGVETLDFGGSRWVRMMPPSGDRLSVKIVGTNVPSAQIEMGREVLRR